jgi:hypothetical protein
MIDDPSLVVQQKLGELVDFIEKHHNISNGKTALYWRLLYQINAAIKEE